MSLLLQPGRTPEGQPRDWTRKTWLDLFGQAADLGVLQVHLSGGEPTLRRDLEQMIARLAARGVYTNLITAGVGIADGRIEAFAEAGLDHLQLSFQGARPETTAAASATIAAAMRRSWKRQGARAPPACR